MKITKKSEYAMRAMVDLAMNYAKKRQIQEIVREEAIPERFLEQILLTLKNAGFVESKRGVGGGYSLSRSPEEISLGEVMRTIDGPLAPLSCLDKGAQVNCPREVVCGIRSVVEDVAGAMTEILDNVSLAEVCDRTRGMTDRRTKTLMYYI